MTGLGPGGPWEQAYGCARTVRAGDLMISTGRTSMVDGVVTHVGAGGLHAMPDRLGA